MTADFHSSIFFKFTQGFVTQIKRMQAVGTSGHELPYDFRNFMAVSYAEREQERTLLMLKGRTSLKIKSSAVANAQKDSRNVGKETWIIPYALKSMMNARSIKFLSCKEFLQFLTKNRR